MQEEYLNRDIFLFMADADAAFSAVVGLYI